MAQTFTIEEIGARIQQRDPKLQKFTALEIGERAVSRNPKLQAMVTPGSSSGAVASPQAAPVPEKKGFLERAKDSAKGFYSGVKESVTKRSDTQVDALQSMKEGEQGAGRTAFQFAAQPVLAGGDILYEGAKAGFKTFLSTKNQEAVKNKFGSAVKDVMDAQSRKFEKMKIEEPEKAAETQKVIDEFNRVKKEIEEDPRKQRDLDVVLAAIDVAGFKGARKGFNVASDVTKEVATDAAGATARGVSNTAARTKSGASAVLETGPASKATELLQRVPRTFQRVKEGSQGAKEKAARIRAGSPEVKKAIQSEVDEHIINFAQQADQPTVKAMKDMIKIADSPKKIGKNKRPEIVSGNAATAQYDLIEKQRKLVGSKIGDATRKLGKDGSVSIEDSLGSLGGFLQKAGIRFSDKGALDFTGSAFTKQERTKIKELYELATEGGGTLSPYQIYKKDQLFSKLQREARFEGIGKLLIDTPDGPKSMFQMFRDTFNSKLDDLSPEIRGLNGEYRQVRQLLDDIEGSIIKSPNFNAAKTVDSAKSAQINLRRIFSNAQSASVYGEITNLMDDFARNLGYAGARPDELADFALELKKLYADAIAPTGFTGGIRLGVGEIASKIAQTGKPITKDKQDALRSLIDSLDAGKPKGFLQKADNLEAPIKKTNTKKVAVPKVTKKVDVPKQPKKAPAKKITGSLEEQAKKFKTADEFVEAQPKVFHGTNQDFKVFGENQSGLSSTKMGSAKTGHFFTSSNEEAMAYAKLADENLVPNENAFNAKHEQMMDEVERLQKSQKWDEADVLEQKAENFYFNTVRDKQVANAKVMEVVLTTKKPLVQEINGSINSGQIEEIVKKAKEAGNDSVILKNVVDNPSGSKVKSDHTIVFDGKNIKTKSQLTDIWKKANKN